MKKSYKKLKRCLILFLAFLVLSCSIFSVSAEHFYSFNMPISQPNVSDDFAYLEVVQQLPEGHYEAFVYLISCKGLSVMDNSIGVFRSNASRDRVIFHNNKTDEIMNVYCVGQSGMIWNIGSVVEGELVDAYSGKIVSMRIYGNIRAQDPEWYDLIPTVFVYGSDNISNQLLNEIRILLENSSGSAGSIVGSIQSGTNEIIREQEENTDKVINGWQSEDKPDTSVTDDYGQKDAELQESTAAGRSETVSIFNNFGALFQSEGHLYRGLLSVTAIFSELTKIEWIGSLLNFSLALGVFAFVIGTSVHVFRSAHERPDSKKEISKSEQGD